MKTCPRCKEEHAGQGVHCSLRCARMKDLPYKVCRQCGLRFRKSNQYSYATWEALKYCSNACKGLAATNPPNTCETCGKSFTPHRGRRNSNRFCSSRCYGDWTMKMATLESSDGLTFSKGAKRALLERAGHQCQECGATESLEFDHIVPKAAGGEASMDNGQVLCQQCHWQKTLAERRLMQELLRAHIAAAA